MIFFIVLPRRGTPTNASTDNHVTYLALSDRQIDDLRDRQPNERPAGQPEGKKSRSDFNSATSLDRDGAPSFRLLELFRETGAMKECS